MRKFALIGIVDKETDPLGFYTVEQFVDTHGIGKLLLLFAGASYDADPNPSAAVESYDNLIAGRKKWDYASNHDTLVLKDENNQFKIYKEVF